MEKVEKLTFEESINALEAIVSKLEQGDIPLEEALTEFAQGIELIKNSQLQLDKAKQKVSILTQSGHLNDFEEDESC